jgi:hypothetical protein
MISIKTFLGQPFQTIHVTEDDVTYNDLLKYIKIPPHPRFKQYKSWMGRYFDMDVTVKPYVKFFHLITDEVKLNDIIDFDTELTIGFYFEYYSCNEKFADDFNLPDTSTDDKCKVLIDDNPFNIIFINDEMQSHELCKFAVGKNTYVLEYIKNQTSEICKLAVQEDGSALQYVTNQTEEICKLAVQEDGSALQYVTNQTEEICKLAVQEDGYSLQFVKEQTEEICKLAVQEDGCALQYVKKQTEEIYKLANWQLNIMDTHYDL